MRYTEAQERAIATLDDPLLIVACAGSGKTQVISRRVVEILKRADVTPRNVVAFTFTEKAAAELKDRITTLVEYELGTVQGLADMYVGTMHGYAMALLQRHVPETFKYRVFDEVQSRLFADRNSNKAGLSTARIRVAGRAPRAMRRYVDSRVFLQAMNVLREDEVDESLLPDDAVQARDLWRHALHQNHALDFTELLRMAVDLLGSDEDDETAGSLVRFVRDTVRYVVVDEYQDTNPVQEQLIAGLTRFGANLCVVGDDDQTIYQWRGSAVSNIQQFDRRHPGVQTVTLDDNFRSSPAVVDLAQSVAELNAGERLPKRMVAAGHQRYEPGDVLALQFDDAETEARWLADRMVRLRGQPFVDRPDADPRGLAWSDMAVLYRSVAKDAGPLVEELKRRKTPYVVKGLNRLFEAPEVRACVASFRYVVQQLDADDVREAWRTADLGLDEATLDAALGILESARDWRAGERWGTYSIQRTYLDLLERMGLREESIPTAAGSPRGELVFYNLGKFSQAISDFEQIHFQSEPARKYEAFVGWLTHQAPDYYAESDADVGYATPDAVTLATVHQAKGLQWPAVFVPALRRNRFPSKRHGGVSVFHVIPDAAVPDADRYRGTVADEARLFYVAITRAQKYLALSHSPGTSALYRGVSDFFRHATRNHRVLTAEPPITRSAIEPRPRQELPDVVLSFSDLKYLFECPYQFKLRFLYGFNPPIHEALGYGKSVHDVLAEVHQRALEGDIVTDLQVSELVDRHLSVPFAYPALREQLRAAARSAVHRYLTDNGHILDRTLHTEQQVQVHIAPGITVDGRIDLIRRLDIDQTSVVDFKSTQRAQAEDITREQLHVYVLGYEELSGERADLVEVLNLDESSVDVREVVDARLLDETRRRIRAAGDALRENRLARHSTWCESCGRCDLAGLCRRRPS